MVPRVPSQSCRKKPSRWLRTAPPHGMTYTAVRCVSFIALPELDQLTSLTCWIAFTSPQSVDLRFLKSNQNNFKGHVHWSRNKCTYELSTIHRKFMEIQRLFVHYFLEPIGPIGWYVASSRHCSIFTAHHNLLLQELTNLTGRINGAAQKHSACAALGHVRRRTHFSSLPGFLGGPTVHSPPRPRFKKDTDARKLGRPVYDWHGLWQWVAMCNSGKNPLKTMPNTHTDGNNPKYQSARFFWKQLGFLPVSRCYPPSFKTIQYVGTRQVRPDVMYAGFAGCKSPQSVWFLSPPV